MIVFNWMYVLTKLSLYIYVLNGLILAKLNSVKIDGCKFSHYLIYKRVI